jgi:hypothetical protein
VSRECCGRWGLRQNARVWETSSSVQTLQQLQKSGEDKSRHSNAMVRHLEILSDLTGDMFWQPDGHAPDRLSHPPPRRFRDVASVTCFSSEGGFRLVMLRC